MPGLSKVKNVSGSDRVVPSLGRQVLANEVVEVPEEAVYGFTCQESNWAPGDAAAKKVHDREHAAQIKRNTQPNPAAEPEADQADAEKENH